MYTFGSTYSMEQNGYLSIYKSFMDTLIIKTVDSFCYFYPLPWVSVVEKVPKIL